MNILVTGCNGQLGRHIELAARKSSHNFLYTDIDKLDITHRDEVVRYVKEHDIDCVLNCAAYTNVDAAEDNEETADLINHVAVGYMAEAMKSRDGLLVSISTDYVFGGEKYNTPYPETAQASPTGAYGRTKYAGEQAIVKSKCRYIIIRTSWLYSEYGKNFVKTMLALGETKEQLSVVYDQVGSPTYAGDLAEVIVKMLETGDLRERCGIYNYSNEGVCSWYDLAKTIFMYVGNERCRVKPCLSSEYPSKVRRPAYSVFDKNKIKKTYGLTIPYWTESLKKCIDNLTI